MKSTVPMLFSICLFVTGLMFGLSGFNEQVGIGEYQTVNVTLLGNLSSGTQLEQLYWDTDDRNLTTSPTANTVELTIGEDIEQRRATTTATRVVTLHGRDVTMQVVVS